MPTRTKAQIIGDKGERLVETLIDNHALWVARRQTHDFGIDLEAELAQPCDEGQFIRGKLIKLQIKTSQAVDRQANSVNFQIERRLLDYADGFRIPVILAVVCLESNSVWWLWLQEWTLLNEARIVQRPDARTISVRIPLEQTLAHGLDAELPAIATGSKANSMILALQNIVEASVGWESREIADGVIEILGKVHGDSRSWILEKVIDKLLGLGPYPRWWEAQQMLPQLLKVVEIGGDSFTSEQILRLVGRGESYSRTGLLALAHLFDWWREPTAGLFLSKRFKDADLGQVAWYAAMRERYPTGRDQIFALQVARSEDLDLQHGNYRLELTEEVRDYIVSKWPNRGESVLIDCLSYIEQAPAD